MRSVGTLVSAKRSRRWPRQAYIWIKRPKPEAISMNVYRAAVSAGPRCVLLIANVLVMFERGKSPIRGLV